MLTLYRLLTRLATPLALRRLERDAGADMAGRRDERLGDVEPVGAAPIWIHAASVGEVNAAAVLVEALQKRCPALPLVISTMTASGARRCQERLGPSIAHRFAPLDTRPATRRWLAALEPRVGLITETEIWPELFHQCAARKLPLAMINARVSQVAMRRYRRVGRLMAPALGAVSLAACQSDRDAERLHELGLPEGRAVVTGNMKFDFSPPADLETRADQLETWLGQRPVWVAGSTRPGEEEIVLRAHQRLRQQHPKAVLILAPRHIDRADDIADLMSSLGMDFGRLGEALAADRNVMLVDRMGWLLPAYSVGQAALVGGTLVAGIGGHNLLEPGLAGCPVIAGPHVENQQEMASALDQAGALVKVLDSSGLAEAVAVLIEDEDKRRQRIDAAGTVIAAGRGAVDRTLQALSQAGLLPIEAAG